MKSKVTRLILKTKAYLKNPKPIGQKDLWLWPKFSVVAESLPV